MARLDEVLDPEIDRSVVAMGFVQNVHEADGNVRVDFRLPTHWCGANFAFMMASDMREAIEALPWAKQAEVRLLDHFASGRINRAVAARGGFAEVFPGEPSGDLAGLRRDFLEKAFLGRQETVLRELTRRHGVEAALALRIGDLRALCEGDLAAEARRYLAVRRQIGGAYLDTAPAFTDVSGNAITASGYSPHLRHTRRARAAAEANAEHCQILMLGRQSAPAPDDRSSPGGIYE